MQQPERQQDQLPELSGDIDALTANEIAGQLNISLGKQDLTVARVEPVDPQHQQDLVVRVYEGSNEVFGIYPAGTLGSHKASASVGPGGIPISFVRIFEQLTSIKEPQKDSTALKENPTAPKDSRGWIRRTFNL